MKYLLIIFAWLGSFTTSDAQNSISIHWNNEVGCQIANPDDDPDRKYEELIEDETCLRVCENSAVQYTLQGDDNSTWISTVWNVTGGVISSSSTSSCNVTWGSAGGGSISATVTTTLGVQSLPLLCIELIKRPIAQFTVEPFRDGQITLCTRQDIYFTNNSSSNGGSELVSYLWNFGDGIFSAEANPMHTYANAGNYDVTLEVTNACNCKSSIRVTVNVGQNGINIECPSVVCEGEITTYSVPIELRDQCRDGMNWSVTGGTIISQQPYRETIDVIWNNVNATGFGVVNFDTTLCNVECPSITSVKVPVITTSATIQGDITICTNKQARYTLPKWPTTDFQWSIVPETAATLINTDQRNEVIIVPNGAGEIILRATYQNTLLNCGGTTRDFIIQVTDPVEIIGPPQICIGTQAYSLPNGLIGFWRIFNNAGNQIQSITGNSISRNFSTAGNFTVSVEGSTFCTPEPIKVKVLAKPVVPDQLLVTGKRIICPGTPYTYKFNNTEPGTVIGWDVVGGTLLGGKFGNEVTVLFTPGAPTYAIKLWREYSTNPHCKSDIITIPINIPDLNLQIKEAAPEGLEPCPSTPHDYSLNMFGTTTLYEDGEVYSWSIVNPLLGSVVQGDGTPNVTILWNETIESESPTTQIKVSVRKCNLFYDFFLNVTINKVPPLAISVPTTICNNTPFQPTISPPGSGYEVQWYVDGIPFSDDEILPEIAIINSNNPASSIHIISAVVSNYNSCETFIELTKEVTVYGIPEGSITPIADKYFCNTVNPFNLTISAQPIGTTIKWYKNNSEIVSALNATTYSVTDFGEYYVVLTNAGGCSSTTNKIFVFNSCVAGAPCILTPNPEIVLSSSNTGCLSASVTATSVLGTPSSYSWGIAPQGASCDCSGSLQAGSTATLANFSFTKPDKYTVFYQAEYPTGTGAFCSRIFGTPVIIPYLADVESNVQCNSTNGTYGVTFNDVSTFYYETPVETRTFIIDGVPYTQSGSSKTVQLAPGNHTIKLIISRTGYPSCETQIETINLPGFPNATFTYSSNVCNNACGEVCRNKALLFTVSNTLANQTYLWDFGDGSKNTQQQPSKVYSTAGTYLVKLTIRNEFGCENSFTKNVIVRANGLTGTVSATPPLTCEGNAITLNYNNGNPLSVVTNYQWMRDNNPLVTTTVGTLTVNESGSYWVKTQDNFGCTSETFATSAAFVMVPDAVILGPDAVCKGQAFQLSGYAGGTTTQYQWLKDGVVFLAWSNNNYKLEDILEDTEQLFTYTLQVRVPNGAGWCYLPDQTKGVMVYGPPAPPQVSIATVANSCNPYNLNVSANSIGNVNGTFTWSNGQSASNTTFHDITVFQGGPLEVTFTNPAGCSASTTVIIPKDPSVYMWIFPEGCYQSCDRPDEFLLGPNAEFVNWQWNVNGVSASTGSGFVDDFELPWTTSSINLVLDNGLCERTSRTMTNTIEDCVDCRFDVTLERLTVRTDPFCQYILDLGILNQNNFNMTVTVTAGHEIGIFIPTTITLPQGPSQHSLTMVPGNNFVGGVVTLTFQSINDRGERCIFEIDIDFGEPCNQGIFRPSKAESFTEDTIGKIQKLDIAPNPANHVTELYYEYPDTVTTEDRIEIYDLLGRLIASHQPEHTKGRWSLYLNDFASGHYIVLMKNKNQILEQKHLIVK